jgi:hypothetical protein
MRIWMHGVADDYSHGVFTATLEDGTCVGIRDKDKEIVIESQDTTHTAVIQCTFAEIERVYNWCKGTAL